MAGLLDLYGDALTPDQTRALQQRGLLGFLGGMQKSGALDYTAPFLSGKVPGGFAAGLAGGAGGMGEAQDAGALNAMRANLLGLQGQELRGKLGLYGAAAQTPPPMYGGAPSAAGPSAAGPSAAGPAGADTLLPSAGDSLTDPRGLIPFIAQTATKYGIDPAIAIKVAGSEGLSNPTGDGGTSHGALQLHTAPGAVGDLFQKTTGLDPADPANEKATIDFGLKYAAQNGWGAWSGAKKLGLAPFAGIGAAPRGPGVFTAAMGGSGSSAPPQQGLLPASPSADANFNARGQYHDPGLGTWAPPAAQGLLAQPAGSAPAAPAGGMLAPPASGQPGMLSPPLQPAAPGGMMPGGAMTPGGINPAYVQWAQQQANARSALGVPVPGYMNEAGGLPFVGPKAVATAEAENASKYKYAGPIARETSRNTLTKLGPGETLYDPLKGVVTQTPKLPEFHPNAARDAFDRPISGIVTFGANGGAVTPTQGGAIAGAAAPGAAGSATGGAMLTPGEIEQNKAQGAANVKRSEALYDGIQSQSTQFQRDMNPYLQLSKSILNTPGMYSGAGGQWSLDFNRVKAALGDTNAAMMQEALGKVTAQSVLSQINNQRAQMQESGGQSSRIFSSQVELVEKAAPAMTTTVGGNRFLVNVAGRMGELSNTVAEMAREYKSQHGILDTGFDKQLSDYMKAHPVFTKQELEHPQVLGAPDVPPSVQSPDQLTTWASSMGIRKGDPIRLPNGSVKQLP